MKIFSALIRSFFTYLFVLLTGGTLVLLATFPAIGKPLAAPMCDGVVETEKSTWSAPGEVRVSYVYYCVSENGAREPISDTSIMIRAGIYLASFITIVIWPLLFLLYYRRATLGNRLQQQIHINGVPLNNIVQQTQNQQPNSIMINGVPLEEFMNQSQDQQQ